MNVISKTLERKSEYILSDLKQWPPIFFATGAGFVEHNFSTGVVVVLVSLNHLPLTSKVPNRPWTTIGLWPGFGDPWFKTLITVCKNIYHVQLLRLVNTNDIFRKSSVTPWNLTKLLWSKQFYIFIVALCQFLQNWVSETPQTIILPQHSSKYIILFFYRICDIKIKLVFKRLITKSYTIKKTTLF